MPRVALVVTALVAVAIGVGIGLSARSLVSDRPALGELLSALPTPAPTRVALTAPSGVAASSMASGTRPGPTAAVPPTPASPDVVMEVSEADLNQQFSSKLVGQALGKTPLGDARVRSVAVQLRNRQVKLDGDAIVGFVEAPFSVVGTVTPNTAGRPMVNVSEATVGGVLLPEAARDALAEQVQTQVDGMFDQGNVKVQTIDIADGRMRVIGKQGS